MADHTEAIEDEIERLDSVIRAAEDWSTQYRKDPKSHAKLIKTEAKVARLLRGYFRDLAQRAPTYVNWANYNAAIRAFDVNVILIEELLGGEDDTVLKLLLDPLTVGVATGALAGEQLYKIDLGLSQTHNLVQQAAKQYIAGLVGKRVDKYGQIVDNPKADYRISDRTRDDIRESIRTSLSIGEDQQAAIARLGQTIQDARRAQTIAATESVNAYQKGLMLFANESKAVGKEWLSINNEDICAENANAGIIGIDEDFPSGDSEPAAHPNCRCSLRLVYQEELNGQ